MSQVITIGLDIAKNVFHAHGADERGAMVFSRKLTRGKLLDFFAGQPACVVALEACGGAHHWASSASRSRCSTARSRGGQRRMMRPGG